MKHSKPPENWKGSDLKSRAEVCQWIHDHGDEVHDPQGMVVGTMRRDLNRGRAISQLVGDMTRDGMLEREVRGQRTFMLRLVDDWGLLSDLRAQPAYRRVPAPKDGDGGPQITADTDLDALAAALLVRVVKTINQPSKGAETERLREKCDKQAAEIRELRDKLIIAVESEHEHRRQADKMRDSLAKLQNAKLREADKPKRGSVKLIDALSPSDRRVLESLKGDLQ